MIQHEAFVNLYNADNKIFNKLIDGVVKVNTFLNRIDKLSEKSLDYGYVDKQTSKGIELGSKSFKGHLFEIFTEVYLSLLGSHPSIGVYNYRPVDSVHDNGVDGYGLGINGLSLTVQVKFRSNAMDELIAEDLKQFGFQSIVNYNVDKDTKTNMILFTCGKGLHYHTDNEVFMNRIRTIGIKQLEYDTNGNFPFWQNFADMIEKTVEQRYNKDIFSKFLKIKL